MTKEIGSEFDISINVLSNDSEESSYLFNLFVEKPIDIIYLSNGRTAIKFVLSHILKKYEIRKCWLPSYLCETMVQPFKELKLDYEFYNIKEGLEVDTKYLSNRVKKGDLVLATYYFGFPQSDEVIDFFYELKKIAIILEDLTHSFLTNNVLTKRIGDYSIISTRKWFGIPEGGIAISNNDLFNKDLLYKEPFYEFANLRLAAAILKNLYLNGIIHEKEYFRQIFAQAEELANSGIKLKAMSKLSFKILNSIDFNLLVSRRRANFLFLLSNITNYLTEITPLYNDLKEGVCPLNFPIIATKRKLLRDFLRSNNIFCPIHWVIPREIHAEFSYAYYLSENILSIPIDQRYSINDMEIIVEKIKEFLLRS
jgi:dTDP-4-amino-4,6-dideoxygalactose transaminase